MPVSWIDLPVEIQVQILKYIYKPWHLYTERVPAFSGHHVYTFRSSSRIEAGPLRACRSMRKLAWDFITSNFKGELHAHNTSPYYSIMPRFRYFLPKISHLYMNQMKAFEEMAPIYLLQLSGLKAIVIRRGGERHFPHSDYDVFVSLHDLLNTTIHDWEIIKHHCGSRDFYNPPVVDAIVARGVEVHHRQAFIYYFAGCSHKIIVQFNVSTTPVSIISKELDMGNLMH